MEFPGWSNIGCFFGLEVERDDAEVAELREVGYVQGCCNGVGNGLGYGSGKLAENAVETVERVLWLVELSVDMAFDADAVLDCGLCKVEGLVCEG